MGYQYFVSYDAPHAFLAITVYEQVSKTGDKVVVVGKRMPVIIMRLNEV